MSWFSSDPVSCWDYSWFDSEKYICVAEEYKGSILYILGTLILAGAAEYYSRSQPLYPSVESIPSTHLMQLSVQPSWRCSEQKKTYTNLVLSTFKLPAGSWAVNRKESCKGIQGESEVKLGEIKEKAGCYFIKLIPSKFPEPIKLTQIFFTLSFTDPNGKEGSRTISWWPNSDIVDPAIHEAYKKAFPKSSTEQPSQ